MLYLVIGIAIDPIVDSLHPCMHDLAPGNYPLEIPSGCVSRAYLVQFEQSHVLKEQANTSRARAAREQSRTSTAIGAGSKTASDVERVVVPICLLKQLSVLSMVSSGFLLSRLLLAALVGINSQFVHVVYL